MKMHLFTEKLLSRRDNLNLCDLFHMMTELSLCNSKLAPFFLLGALNHFLPYQSCVEKIVRVEIIPAREHLLRR